MIEAVEARKASRGTLVQGRHVMARQLRRVMLRYGPLCYGLARQSCLGTFRRVAVKFGEARQSGQVMVL